MTDVARLLTDVVGEEVGVEPGFGPPTVDVPASHWRTVLTALRDVGFTFFDFLTAVDELGDGFRVVCHVAAVGAGPSAQPVEHLVLRTLLPRAEPTVESAVSVYAGAAWHERETHEMFGIDFTGGDEQRGLLLPEGFEGHPLRKEFVLAARVVKPWPGAKDPGESDHDLRHAAPSRRRTRPPGVPDESQWGPREPGSEAPDPLAHAQPAPAARPRRGRRAQEGAGDGAGGSDGDG